MWSAANRGSTHVRFDWDSDNPAAIAIVSGNRAGAGAIAGDLAQSHTGTQYPLLNFVKGISGNSPATILLGHAQPDKIEIPPSVPLKAIDPRRPLQQVRSSHVTYCPLALNRISIHPSESRFSIPRRFARLAGSCHHLLNGLDLRHHPLGR